MNPWRWIRTRCIGPYRPIRRPEFEDRLGKQQRAARADLTAQGLAIDQGSSLEQRRGVMRGEVVAFRRAG